MRAALTDAAQQFERGPFSLGACDSEEDARPAFIVRDGHYVSARWPGDAYLFATEFMQLLD